MKTKWLILFLLWPSQLWAGLDEAKFQHYEDQVVTRITIRGNKVTKEYIITRELGLQVGRPFRLATLKRDVQNLDNLGIFSSIHVTPSDYENGVALEYKVRELPWILPYVKFKFTEENGWSVGPTLTSVNMFGRDIYVSGFWLFGGQNQFSLRVIQPWITGPHLSLDIVAAHISRTNELDGFEESSDELTIAVGRYIGQSGRAKAIASYFGVESKTDGHTLSADNHDNFYRFGGSLGYDSRDSWQDPHKGWLNELKVLGTVGDGEFWTLDFDVRRFQPLIPRHTLALGALTTLQTGDVGVDVPEYLRYHMGGANSIRGYDVNELGKTLVGKNQLITTVEYRFVVMPIKEYEVLKWAVNGGLQLAAFADVGIAWNESDEFNMDRTKAGFGVGVRFLVPGIDVMRLDVGFNGEGGVHFHLGLWSKFAAQRLRLR